MAIPLWTTSVQDSFLTKLGIRIARTIYHQSGSNTARNLKLALRAKLSTGSTTSRTHLMSTYQYEQVLYPEFIKHFNVKISTVANISDLTNLKHEEKNRPSDLMLEVSKLIKNMASTAQPLTFPIQEAFTED